MGRSRASLLKGEDTTSVDSEPTASHESEAILGCPFQCNQLQPAALSGQPTELWEMIDCFKLLNFGVVCYMAEAV